MITDAGMVPAPRMRAAAASLERPGRGRGGRRPAPTKAALPGGAAETVLAQLTVDSAGPGRAAQLRTVARGCRQLALARPHVVPLLVTRPLATPLALRPLGTHRAAPDAQVLVHAATERLRPPEQMFCAVGLSNGYWFDRHSYSAIRATALGDRITARDRDRSATRTPSGRHLIRLYGFPDPDVPIVVSKSARSRPVADGAVRRPSAAPSRQAIVASGLREG